MNLAIIDYGAGNVFSVASAFKRLGVEPVITSDRDLICSADRVIFPGVGHAAAAMNQLRATGLDIIIPELKQPVFGICLGMQLMCSYSEEGNTDGLGIFENINVTRFDNQLKTPHMGWNTIQKTNGLLANLIGDVYFVHSFYAPIGDYTVARSEYGVEFSAALQRDNFIGCQFHPEKSSSVGEDILKRFLTWKP